MTTQTTTRELDSEREIRELKDEIYSLQKELDKIEDTLEARDDAIASHAEFKIDHRHCAHDREQAADQINMLSDEVERLRNILIEKNDHVDGRIQSLRVAKKNATDSLEAARLEISSLQSQLMEAQAKYEDSSRIAIDNQSKLDEAMSNATALTKNLQVKDSVIRDLEAQLDAANRKMCENRTQYPPPETIGKGGVDTDETLTDKDENTEGEGNGPTANTTRGPTPTPNSTQSRDSASPPTARERRIPPRRLTHRYPYNKQTERGTGYLDRAKELGVTFYVSKNYQGTNPIKNYTDKKKQKGQYPYRGTKPQRGGADWKPEHRRRAPPQVAPQNHDNEKTPEILGYSESNDRRMSDFENNTRDEFEGIKALLWNMMETIENLNKTKTKHSFTELKQLMCAKCNMTHSLCTCV